MATVRKEILTQASAGAETMRRTLDRTAEPGA